MSTSLGRFRILGQNELAMPGKCAVCGTSSGRFIDFGLDLDYYGVVYFCFENCFREAANAFEYHTPAQHKLLKEEVAMLRKDNNMYSIQIEEMERVFSELTRNIASGIVNTTSGVDINVGDDKESEQQDTDEDESGPKTSESESSEPASEQGSTGFFHDNSIDTLIADLDI